jgi:hypothetical protein
MSDGVTDLLFSTLAILLSGVGFVVAVVVAVEGWRPVVRKPEN